MDRKLRLLVISNTPWDDNNSFGNSFSNIFGGGYYEIANIYCQAGAPMTKVASRFFQISEKDIIRKAVGKQNFSGREVFCKKDASAKFVEATELSTKEVGLMKFAKLKRWQILFWGRDFIWAFNRWKSDALKRFILDFKPDVIVQAVYPSSYINEIGIYAQELTGVPMVGNMSDDDYTYHQFHLSPLWWMDRMIKRKYVKRSIERQKILYVIVEKARRVFDDIFGEKCKILYKGAEFKEMPSHTLGTPLKLVYTGNIGSGRWKSLAEVARVLKKINNSGEKAHLYISSPSPANRQILEALNIKGASDFLGCISLKEKTALQRSADIVLNVEAFNLSERYSSWLSFSTKIVDYFEAGKCMVTIGWKGLGPIEYLKANEAGLVITDSKEIEIQLTHLIDNAETLVPMYAKKCWECGKRNHDINVIRENLYMDLSTLAFSEKKR